MAEMGMSIAQCLHFAIYSSMTPTRVVACIHGYYFSYGHLISPVFPHPQDAKFLAAQSNEILTAIVQGMRKEEPR